MHPTLTPPGVLFFKEGAAGGIGRRSFVKSEFIDVRELEELNKYFLLKLNKYVGLIKHNYGR